MNAQSAILKTRGLLILGMSVALTAGSLTAADAGPGAPTSGSLYGFTRDLAGAPVPAVQVVIRGTEGSSDLKLVTGGDGTFVAGSLKPGTYRITAYKEGLVTPAPALVEVAQNQAATAYVIMTKPTAPPASPDNPSLATGLTERERLLLDRIGKLEERLAAMETRQAATNPEAQPLVASLKPGQVMQPPVALAAAAATPPVDTQAPPAAPAAPAPQHVLPEALEQPDPSPTPDNFTPFAFGDFTWLNGTPRNKDTVLDTKFFTPEVRFDTHFMTDFNQPIDHTMGGATESFRSGEFQEEQISVGGDFHWQNVRGRILTMFGLFATTTPRNDASAGVGQWDVRNAYKYVSEAWGGYHFNVNHGLNVDAGIFVSYIGLFSYYNFDNWTYQPSFVSSNTPWFFNGLRIQWFPTNKLKIEPWIINGWQSYNRFNGHHGFGGQILYRPKEWISIVANNYGNGTDTLGNPARVRLHTDDSIEVRYFNDPESTGVSKMAFSLTADAGCEYGKGSGVSCTGKGAPKQAFLGWMAYNRTWFHKSLFALTVGGGQMNNPGRYLTLLPPINGADAISGSPYFTQNPGDKAHMWDCSINLQYMPKQYITWWLEGTYRHSDVPYWTGRGGITPPGGNNGHPNMLVCNDGTPTSDAASCGAVGLWHPDLRRGQATVSAGVLVKF